MLYDNLSLVEVHMEEAQPRPKYQSILLNLGTQQAPPVEVHVVLEIPSGVEEGMCTDSTVI